MNLNRFIVGAFAGGLAFTLAPSAPVEIAIKAKKEIHLTSPIKIDTPDMRLAHLPLPWQELAKCESGGRVNAVSGKYDAFQGAFQIEYPRTWIAHGGDPKTPPAKASLQDQFAVAIHIYNDRGSKPWPYCGRFLFKAYGR